MLKPRIKSETSLTTVTGLDFDFVADYFDNDKHANAKANRLFACHESFRYFMPLYMGHRLTIKPAPYQVESWDMAMLERLLLIWPRGYGKSVTFGIGYPIWIAACDPYGLNANKVTEEIIVVTGSDDLAMKWIRNIKYEVMNNKRLKADFNLQPGEIWRADLVEIVSPYGKTTIEAKGRGSQIRGSHPTELIIDDLENRKDAFSPSLRQEIKEYFFRDLWGTIRQKGRAKTRVKIIGTLVHELGLMTQLARLDWWDKRIYSAVQPDGTALWPDYESIEALEVQRKQLMELDPGAWWSEKMNQPQSSDNPTFKREHFHPYDPELIIDADDNEIDVRKLFVVATLDPAISQRDGADWSAITAYGVTFDEKPLIYCLHADRGHWSPSESISRLIELYHKFPGCTQLIETVGGFRAIYLQYKDKLETLALDQTVIDIVPDKDKGVRANAIQWMFQQKMMRFDHTNRMQNILMDELHLFNFAVRKNQTDDLVDATTMALNYIDNWLRRRTKKAKQGKKLNVMFHPDNPIYGNSGINAY